MINYWKDFFCSDTFCCSIDFISKNVVFDFKHGHDGDCRLFSMGLNCLSAKDDFRKLKLEQSRMHATIDTRHKFHGLLSHLFDTKKIYETTDED